MFISYEDLSKIFTTAIGIKEHNLEFQTVSILAQEYQPRGLYIPLGSTYGDLQIAIANGAIGALWKKGDGVPKYTPNHFPIFFVDDYLDAIEEILIQYKKNINMEDNLKTDTTNFPFLDEKLLKVFYETYDNAVMCAKLTQMLLGIREEKE